MVGGNLGKGYVIIFVLIGSKYRSWTWHPLFIIWSWFEKSICLLFDGLQGHSLCHLWVNAAKSLVVSFICSREVHLKPILSRPYAVVHSLRVSLPCVQSNFHNTLFHLQNLLLISCHWWGIHQGPPVTSFFHILKTWKPPSFLSLDSLNKHRKTRNGTEPLLPRVR